MTDSSPAVPQPGIPMEPIVSFESRVTSGISREVLAAFHRPAPSGNEAGGILLGSRTGDRILVSDFEPVLCEHRFGPAYALSDEDLGGLEESLDWFQHANAGGLQVLGFYRSHARPESSIDERDRQLIDRFFPESGSLFLLLRPGRGDTITAELFVEAGGLRPSGHPMLFPADHGISGMRIAGRGEVSAARSAASAEASAPASAGSAEVNPANASAEVITPKPLLPPRRSRREETQEIVGRNWTWVAAVAALTLAGAILGYRSAPPRNRQPAPEAPVSSSPAQTPASEPMPAPAPGTAARTVADTGTSPAVPPETEQGIRDALAQWQQAVRSGDPNLIAACYASQLDRYFNQRNSTPSEVRRAAAQSMARYGRPAILRISELTVTPVSENRAVASFRKHWQTDGPRIFAGEEQERLTFVRTEDVWKIASEEEVKVYWTQRPRV